MNKFVGVLAAMIVASGCVVDVVFEPIGGDVRVDGQWTINGGTADAISCGSAGIATVQLFVCDAVDGDCYGGAEISSACENGAFLTGPILKPDFYAYYWVARDASGAQIGISDWDNQTVGDGGTLTASADFIMDMPTEVTLAGSWLINGVAADAATCNAAGVANVQLEITDDLGAVFRTYELDCADGGFDSSVTAGGPTLPAGVYGTQWFAVDAADNVLAQTDAPLALDVTAVTHANLASPDFGIVLVTALDVAFTYDIGDGTFGDCTAAAIGSWGYFLYTGGGELLVSETGLDCQNGILFEDIASDIYTLAIDASENFDGTGIKWGVDCDGLDVLEGERALYDCAVPIP